jgi:adenine C2-methylase RlmN of 23S rRNA A2503 and tRNA A37
MMPFNNIDELIKMVTTYNIPLKLHFSLHSPMDEKRNALIPSTKVSVQKAFELLSTYRKVLNQNEKIKREYHKFHSNYDFIEIHYTLINDVNDSPEELALLYDLLSTYKIPIKFISFNPKDNLKKSAKEELWLNKLHEIDGLIVKKYSPPGREVGSSCGEFTKHYYHEEIETPEELAEFENWKKTHEIK